MKTFTEFIKDNGSRSASASAKFDLLVHGVRDNENLFMKYAGSFKEEHYAYDNGNWGVDKRRSTPTEIILPGGIVSKIHIRPNSPLHLEESQNCLVVCNDNREISEFRFLQPPKFWVFNKKWH